MVFYKIYINISVQIFSPSLYCYVIIAGKEGHLEVLRDGKVLHKLAVDNNFEYDTPVGHE